jgi:hypothetical protein
VKKVSSSADAYRLFYNLAYAQYRLGDMAGGRLNSAKARAYTKIPAEIASLDRLEQALDRPKSRAEVTLPRTDEDGDAPRLMRRPAGDAPVERSEAPALPQLPSFDGTLENMECGALARLHVRAEGAVRIFVIPDPTKVAIHGTNGESIELQCGAQKPPRALHIEYQAMPSMAGVAGVVRTLEFR